MAHPNNKTPEAVFFDLDGTLIDTAPDMGGALNTMLTKRKKPLVAEAVYRPLVSHGSIALLKLGFPEIFPTHLEELSKEQNLMREEFLLTYEQGIADDSALFDGMEYLLSMLESKYIPWGIITNKPERLTLLLLEAMNLTNRCCSIIGADTASHSKPHPAPMRMACKQSGVTAENCFYLGDAERDIQAGQAVSMKTFIANWGYIDLHTDKPDSWGADVSLNAPEDLIVHLDLP